MNYMVFIDTDKNYRVFITTERSYKVSMNTERSYMKLKKMQIGITGCS